MDDRRTQNRLPVPRVLVKISTPERMRVAYLKDLSEGGVFIRTDKPLALERVVDVDLLAPGRSEPLRLRGRIVRVQNDEASRVANLQGMGVRFIELTPQQDQALKALVAEFQPRPGAAPATSTPDTGTVALKQALETAEVLRAQLLEREAELKAEHDRRQDLSVRVLTLTKELEGVRARGGGGEGVALEALKVELTASRAELGELKARLAQAEGSVEAYRQEIATLEEDDASTRRLAEALAQQKSKQDAELKRLREDIQHHSHLAEQERGSANARASETGRLLEVERARTRDLEGRVEELSATNSNLATRVTELEGTLDQAKKHVAGMGQTVGELTAGRTRIGTLEQALADEKQKNERLRSRERELRALVAAISAKGGDDVVVMDDGGGAGPELLSPPSVAPVSAPPAAQVQAAVAGVDPWQPGSTMVMMTMPPLQQIEEEPTSSATSPLVPSVAPVVSAAQSDPPAEPEPYPDPPLSTPLDEGLNFPEVNLTAATTEQTISEEVPLDVEVDDAGMESIDGMATDWGGQAIAVPPTADQEQFLTRLRSNDKLVRKAAFFDYSATDPEEQNIIGSLMGADRFEDLKVLSRGGTTPEHLESFLLRFHQLGLIGFS
jgi:type IV pilus assembly protein PilZ